MVEKTTSDIAEEFRELLKQMFNRKEINGYSVIEGSNLQDIKIHVIPNAPKNIKSNTDTVQA